MAARRDFADLEDVERETVDGPEVYAKAMELSERFGHHLFDTLYHAAALLIPDSALLTADRAYYNKARLAGQISLLEDVPRPQP